MSTPGRILFAVAAVCTACGQANFTPDCNIPARGDRARPAAIAVLPDGNAVVAHGDQDESFCGGFLTVHDPTGAEVRDPAMIPVRQGFEANFSSLVLTDDVLWVAGRRYGNIAALDPGTLEVRFLIEESLSDLLVVAGKRRIGAWLPLDGRPEIRWFSESGDLEAALQTSLTRLGAGGWDSANRRIWLGFDGGSNLQYVSADQLDQTSPVFPLGVGTNYSTRGLAVTGGQVWISDYSKALVARIDAGSGEIVDASEVGFRPEGLSAGPDGRIWATDGSGDVYVRDNDWTLVRSGLDRPIGLAAGAGMAWVSDFAENLVTTVSAP